MRDIDDWKSAFVSACGVGDIIRRPQPIGDASEFIELYEVRLVGCRAIWAFQILYTFQFGHSPRKSLLLSIRLMQSETAGT